jgi:site-specific recombinase XerD
MKWGNVEPSNIVKKLNAEKFCGATYNRRLTMLKLFGTWLVANQVWKTNPLITVSRKKQKKITTTKKKALFFR